MITLHNLEFGYNKQTKSTVLFDSLSSGIYFLVGANGSGKSTFLKTLFGEIPAVNGEIIIQSTLLNNLHHLKKAQLIAYMNTSTPAVDYLTAIDFIELGETPYMNRTGKKNVSESVLVNTFIQQFNLQSLQSRFLSELSDGEKQLFSIIKTLNQNTPIILLDEPTSFLDPKNKRLLFDSLYSFAKEKQRMILISTHDIEIASEYPASFLVLTKKSMSLKNDMDLEDLLKIY